MKVCSARSIQVLPETMKTMEMQGAGDADVLHIGVRQIPQYRCQSLFNDTGKCHPAGCRWPARDVFYRVEKLLPSATP